MGNRAVITTKERELALYLHWNGGRDTVEPLLRYCELQGYRPPSSDSYGWARMAQVMGNFFGGSLSVGIDRFDRIGDQGDNGVYVIDGWRIVERVREERDGDWSVVGWRAVDPSEEQRGHDFGGMLRAFDEAMPEGLRLGDFLGAVEVPASEVLFIKSGFTAFEPLNHMFYRVGCLGGSGQVGVECLMRLYIYVGRSVLCHFKQPSGSQQVFIAGCFLVSKRLGKIIFRSKYI